MLYYRLIVAFGTDATKAVQLFSLGQASGCTFNIRVNIEDFSQPRYLKNFINLWAYITKFQLAVPFVNLFADPN